MKTTAIYVHSGPRASKSLMDSYLEINNNCIRRKNFANLIAQIYTQLTLTLCISVRSQSSN